MAEPEIDLAAELCDCLNSIQSSSSFALFSTISNPPNPGLFLRNGGTIGLPLSSRDAEAIVSASHPAPFGKGEKTIVDEAVRKTWELDASAGEFELRNPAWESFLKDIVVQVSEGLGVGSGGSVRAELYKLLLYDEGAMFKPHQDSEKAEQMFGTLVIALPSKHIGGEVRVSHAGKEMVLETSPTSEFDASYLAWFADVMHEILPVTAGKRLVLTYNLVHNQLGGRELAANSNISMAKLNMLLNYWQKNCGGSLAYLLEHQYTGANLSLNALKGHDLEVVSHLSEVCSKYDFSLYLASLEMSAEGGCDSDDYGSDDFHPITEEVDRDIYLKKVVDLDGVEKAKDLAFDEDSLVQGEPFEVMKPDDEDYEGYTGNEGVKTTHFYHRTLIVITPRKDRTEFLYGPIKDIFEDRYSWSYKEPKTKQRNINHWICTLMDNFRASPQDLAIRDDIVCLCNLAVRRFEVLRRELLSSEKYRRKADPSFDSNTMSTIIATALELNDQALLVSACKSFPDNMQANVFKPLGSALQRHNLESLLPILELKLRNMHSFSEIIAATIELKNGLDKEVHGHTAAKSKYTDWLQSEIDRAISSPSVAKETMDDGLALATVAAGGPSQDLFQIILPSVKTNVGNTPMAVAFANSVFSSGAQNHISNDVAHTVFRDILSDLAEAFTLRDLETILRTDAASKTPTKSTLPGDNLAELPHSRLVAEMLSNCHSLHLTAENEQICHRMVLEARTLHVQVFETFYMPLLNLLARSPHTIDDPNQYQRLFRHVLGTYILRYIGGEPTKPKTWVRPKVACANCEDCVALNTFLASATENVGCFKLAKNKRYHLESQLRNTIPDYKCDTKRSGNTHTLVVEKTNKTYEKLHEIWKIHRHIVQKHLDEIGRDQLQLLLGDLYPAISTLDVEKIGSWQKSQGLGVPKEVVISRRVSPNRVLPPITKRKVPAEVIVLDD